MREGTIAVLFANGVYSGSQRLRSLDFSGSGPALVWRVSYVTNQADCVARAADIFGNRHYVRVFLWTFQNAARQRVDARFYGTALGYRFVSALSQRTHRLATVGSSYRWLHRHAHNPSPWKR